MSSQKRKCLPVQQLGGLQIQKSLLTGNLKTSSLLPELKPKTSDPTSWYRAADTAGSLRSRASATTLVLWIVSVASVTGNKITLQMKSNIIGLNHKSLQTSETPFTELKMSIKEQRGPKWVSDGGPAQSPSWCFLFWHRRRGLIQGGPGSESSRSNGAGVSAC